MACVEEGVTGGYRRRALVWALLGPCWGGAAGGVLVWAHVDEPLTITLTLVGFLVGGGWFVWGVNFYGAWLAIKPRF